MITCDMVILVQCNQASFFLICPGMLGKDFWQICGTCFTKDFLSRPWFMKICINYHLNDMFFITANFCTGTDSMSVLVQKLAVTKSLHLRKKSFLVWREIWRFFVKPAPGTLWEVPHSTHSYIALHWVVMMETRIANRTVSLLEEFIAMKPEQNGCHFAGDIFWSFFFFINYCILTKISLKFIANGSISNMTALVQIMAWHQWGAKPLSEPMMVQFTAAGMWHLASRY